MPERLVLSIRLLSATVQNDRVTAARILVVEDSNAIRVPVATALSADDQLDRDGRQHLQALLVREAERAGALIAGLLAAARLDAGIDLDLAPISLRTLVHGELDRVWLLHPEATVTMSGPEVIARR